MVNGKLITFEGIDGSGLSTQAQLLQQWLDRRGHEVHLTKEPSEGPSGAILRLMLAKRLERPDPYTLSLLFTADRTDHVVTEIEPFLTRGIHVISDRYYLSSYAYQSEDVPLSWLQQLNKFCIRPDITCWINVDPLVAHKRTEGSRFSRQLTEEPEDLIRVYERYHQAVDLLRREGENIVEINGVQPRADVARDIQKEVGRVVSKSTSRINSDSPSLEQPRLPLT